MGKALRVALPFEPYRHQREAHQRRRRFSVLVWHRRAGKTVFAIVELVLAAAGCKREGGRFAYVAPLLKQAKDVAWDYLKHFTRALPGCAYNETELSVELPNGARVRLYGADNPDAARGIYLDGVVLDELAQMKASMWGEVLRPALADRKGWALFIGTFKGINAFTELYFNAQKEAANDNTEWHADLRRASETGVIPAEELAAARAAMSPQLYAQEFECDPYAAVENVLIPVDVARAATQRDMKRDGFEWAARVLGVDVARFGDDRSVIFKRQGPVAFRPTVLRNLDTMALAAQVAHVAREWDAHAVFVDVTGVGAGVVDRLRQLGVRCLEVNFGSGADVPTYKNKRAEMWAAMGEWLKTGCLPDDSELLMELSAPTYFFDSAGRLQLESKDDMRERGLPSPDKADALACTFAAPVAAPDIVARGGEQVATRYNPFRRHG